MRVQPPSRVPKGTALTPAPEVTVEFASNDHRVQQAGEMFVAVIVYNLSDKTPVETLTATGPRVRRIGDSTYVDFTFPTIRIDDPGIYGIHAGVFLFDSSGTKEFAGLNSNKFEVY
ncbi:8655a6f2-1ead-43e3-91d5-66d622eb01f7 [Thermothielavioides terrestris]|nr:8655a6f2-1ead-43e3-91d5-66d622eb01f7 [Thermothielavioides terrestris]